MAWGKFKFQSLELSVIFSGIFNPRLVESTDAEPVDMAGQLYFIIWFLSSFLS